MVALPISIFSYVRTISAILGIFALTACWQEEDTRYPGYIEADTIQLTSEESGRIAQLMVETGDHVAHATRLFALDDTLLQTDLRVQEAKLEAAQAQLALLSAPQQREIALAALRDRRRVLSADLRLIEKTINRQRPQVRNGHLSPSILDTSLLTQERLNAQLDALNKDIELGSLPVREEHINKARADVQAQEALVQRLKVRLEHMQVYAPAKGDIMILHRRVGELASPASPVLTMRLTETLRAVFYVDEPSRHLFSLGKPVIVFCDGCAIEGLEATVNFIDSEAAFTPPVIYSEEQRSKLVYRIEAHLLSPVLSAGQPVSVLLATSEKTQ